MYHFNLIELGPDFEIYKQKKYETELNCALKMSYALEEEKKRLLAQEEEDFKVIKFNEKN